MFFRDSYMKHEQAMDPLVSIVYAKLEGMPPVRVVCLPHFSLQLLMRV